MAEATGLIALRRKWAALGGAVALLASVVGFVATAGPAAALPTTWYVSATGSGVTCSSGSPCTLDEALSLYVSGDTIQLATGDYTGAAVGVSGLPITISPGTAQTLIIQAAPGAAVTLDGGAVSQVLNIGTLATVTLSGVTVANGSIAGIVGLAGTSAFSGAAGGTGGSGTGGGIANAGTLTVENSTLTANGASGGIGGAGGGGTGGGGGAGGTGGNGMGGAIYNTGTLTVTDSTFAANDAMGGPGGPGGSDTGGGNGGTGGNGGNGMGGAIYNSGTVTIESSTISANPATGGIPGGGGGGFLPGAPGFTAGTSTGGGLDNAGGTASTEATILVDSPPVLLFGGDCAGTVTNNGYNADDDGTCLFSGTSISNNPAAGTDLGPPAANGSTGPWTIALTAGNPAIGLIPNPTATYCPAGGVTDERLVTSPAGKPCNAGASQELPQTVSFTSTSPAHATVGGATYTATATATSALAVAFTLDGTSTGCALMGAVVSFTAAGTCVIDANQAGNASYEAAAQVQQSFSVTNSPPPPTPVPTATQLSASTTTVYPGDSVTLTATVTSSTGTPGGTVNFSVSPGGGVTLSNPGSSNGCTDLPLPSGPVTCTASFSTAGTYSLTAAYNGSPLFDASTSTVTVNVSSLPQTTLSLTSSTPNESFFGGTIITDFTPGTKVTYTAKVSTKAGGSLTSGTVTFSSAALTSAGVPGASTPIQGCVNVKIGSDGTATCTPTPYPAAGDFDIGATYSGTSSYAPSSDSIYDLVLSDIIPAITSVSPSIGQIAGGGTVTVTMNEDPADYLPNDPMKVAFGTTAATVKSESTTNGVTTIIVASPPHSLGTVDVTVSDLGGTSSASSADHFTYADIKVKSISPNIGPVSGGTKVSITGSGFFCGGTTSCVTSVEFQVASAESFTVNSDTSITAISPTPPSNSEFQNGVSVYVVASTLTSDLSNSDVFNYINPPSVTSISPASGRVEGGATVSISGSGFTCGSQGDCVSSVDFGTTPATSLIFNSDTSLTATAPPGSVGSVDIRVSTPGGTSSISSGDRFTYTNVLYAAPNGSGTLCTLQSQCGLSTALQTAGSGYTVYLASPGTYAGSFTISEPLTIEPLSSTNGAYWLQGSSGSPVVTVQTGAGVTNINDVTITGGGRGIMNDFGTVNLSNCTITNNTSGDGGGGIDNSGTMAIDHCTISGNTAYGYDSSQAAGGGGIANSGTLTLVDSTVSGNAAKNAGGGGIGSTGTMTIENSTITANSANSGGGGISNAGNGTLVLEGSTLALNTHVGNGADGLDAGSTIYVASSIMADSCDGQITDEGFNAVVVGQNCPESGNGDVTFSASQLGPLANNGGPTETMKPASGSAIIGAVPNSSSVEMNGTSYQLCPNTDQRGDPNTSGGNCDIGAVQTGGTPPPPSITAVTTSTTGACPASGPAWGPLSGGNTVCITGTGLIGATGVTFTNLAGSSAAAATSFTVNSLSEIAVVAPPCPTKCTGLSLMSISVNTPSGTIVRSFAYTYLPTNLAWFVSADATNKKTQCIPFWSGSFSSSPCGLASALSIASAGNIIELTSGSSSPYVGSFTVGTPGTTQLDQLTIEPAAGVTDPVIESNYSGSALTITNGGFYTITGVAADNSLAGITITDSSSGNGGGINDSGGTLTVTHATLSGNRATYGGAIDVNGGALTVTDSTFSNNTASYGGAIDNFVDTHGSSLVGTINVNDSTFFTNSASDDGGALYNPAGSLTVTASTFANNSSSSSSGSTVNTGATIYNGTVGSVMVAADIFDGACAQGTTWQDGGYNVGTDGTCEEPGVTTDSSSMTTIGELDTALLTANGGPTETIALLSGNPAVGIIPNGTYPYCPTGGILDQRGQGSRAGGPCDAGAVQLVLPPATWYVSAHETRVNITCVSRQAGSSANNPCGLTSALQIANPGDTIELTTSGNASVADGAYIGSFTFNTSGTSKTSQLTVEPASGVKNPIIEANGQGAVFTVSNGGFYSITGVAADGTASGITIQNGKSAFGGGITNDKDGTLTVVDSTFSDNNATFGGAINNVGTLTVADSTFSGNSASTDGGAIDAGGPTTITNSTFSGNSASNNGGAIVNPFGAVTVISSTFTGDQAKIGTAIENGSTFTVAADVFSGSCNQAAGTWTDNGYNVGIDGSCEKSGTATDNTTMTTREIGTLGVNGGPTQTVALVTGNPAAGLIPTGTATYCPSGGVTDQRGNTSTAGAACDAGAVQLVVVPPTVTGVSPPQGPVAGGTTVTVTGTGFSCGTSCVPVVTFGTTNGTNVTVASDTSLTVTSPVEASGTPVSVDVTITSPDGATSQVGVADQFTYTPDELAYTANTNDNTVSVVDTVTKKSVKTITVGNTPEAVAITPDHTKAFVVNETPVSSSAANAGQFTNGTVSVIDTATNSVTATITVGQNPVAIAITPDGSKALVVNSYSQEAAYNLSNGTLSVIDTATNKVTSIIKLGFIPLAIAISPDGTKAYVVNSIDLAYMDANPGTATTDLPGYVSVVDTTTGTVAPPIDVGKGPDAIAISPDGTQAYVANLIDNSVSVIDTATNSTVGSAIGVGQHPDAIAFTPDGTKAYVANSDITCSSGTPSTCSYGNGGSISVIDTAHGTVTSTLPVGDATTKGVGAPAGIAIAPNGNAYVTNGAFNTVSIINTKTNAVTSNAIFVGVGPAGIAMLPAANQPAYPHDKLAYVANYNDNTVSVIDTATNSVLSAIGVGSGPDAVATTPDGTMAYVSNFNDNTVSVIDVAIGAVSSTISVGGGPSAIAITPDGKEAFVANYTDGTVSVIDTATGTVSSTFNVEQDPLAIAITPDGQEAYIANSGSGTVSVIDTANLTAAPRNITVGSGPSAIAITPDGKEAFVANYIAGTVSVIDTVKGVVSGTANVETNPISIAITPDGKEAYIGNFGTNTVSVIDTSNLTAAPRNITVGSGPDGISFATDGSEAYVADYNDSTVSVIDTTNLTVSSTFNTGKGPSAIVTLPSSVKTQEGKLVSRNTSHDQTCVKRRPATTNSGTDYLAGCPPVRLGARSSPHIAQIAVTTLGVLESSIKKEGQL